MSKEIIETGKVSSRGQICIPNEIREGMGLAEGSKIIFIFDNDSLIIKKITSKTFAEVTKPLKEVAEKSNFKESEVEEIIHKIRKR